MARRSRGSTLRSPRRRSRRRDQPRVPARGHRLDERSAPPPTRRASSTRSSSAARASRWSSPAPRQRAGLARPARRTGTSACRRRGRWTTSRSASRIASSATRTAPRRSSCTLLGPTLRFREPTPSSRSPAPARGRPRRRAGHRGGSRSTCVRRRAAARRARRPRLPRVPRRARRHRRAAGISAAARPSRSARSADTAGARCAPATCCPIGASEPHASEAAARCPTRSSPCYGDEVRIGVLYGPHAAPDFFTAADVDGVLRDGLEGPLPLEPHRRPPARAEAGMGARRRRRGRAPSVEHPRQRLRDRHDRLHRRHADHPRAATGRASAASSARPPSPTRSCWKVGQLQAGDRVRFVPFTQEEAVTARGAARRRRSRRCARASGCRRPRDARRRSRPSCTRARRAAHPVGDRRAACRRPLRARRVRRRPARPRAPLPRARADGGARRGARRPASPSSRPASARSRSATTRAPADSPRLARRAPRARSASLPSTETLEVPTRIVHLPLSWDDPATRLAIEKYMQIGAARRALVPEQPRVHPAHQRPRPIEATVRRIVFDASLPRARARRRLPRRAGRDAPRSAASPRHDEVQPGAHLDAGERRRHRRRLPLHLRHGGTGRLPVRRPHRAGLEPAPDDARVRAGPAVAAALLRPDPLLPGRAPTSCCACARRSSRAARPRHRAQRRSAWPTTSASSPRRRPRSRRFARRSARAFGEERARWRAAGTGSRERREPARGRGAAGGRGAGRRTRGPEPDRGRRVEEVGGAGDDGSRAATCSTSSRR